MDKQTMHQPPPVTGYRALPQADVDLMNRIKAHEAETLALVREVQERARSQIDAAGGAVTRRSSPGVGTGGLEGGEEGFEVHQTAEQRAEHWRLVNAEPQRWASIAKTELQQGYMALVRAVAQPVTP